jgi:hypothetical protein
MTIRLLLAVCALLTLVTGCMTFDQRWEEARVHHVPAGSIQGRWQGEWSNHTTGRSGSIRCILTPLKSGRYEARFDTRFAGVVPQEHRVVLAGESRGGLWRFRGEQNLGWFSGGVHEYAGQISPDRFFSTFSSLKANGEVELVRPR